MDNHCDYSGYLFLAIKPEKTAELKEIKRIICFILMGILGLGIISNLLSLLQLRRIPRTVFQFLSLGGFCPSVRAILVPLLIRLQRFTDFGVVAGRFILPLLSIVNILLFGGIIFFFATKAKQLKEGDKSLSEGQNQYFGKSDSNDALNVSNKIESKFFGSVFSIFLFSIWAPILLTISLGFATPFIICTVIRWICNNSTIGGKSYRFNGTAMGLFGRWILWYILTIITFGIYGFWSTRNQIRWIIENVEMVN
jgi:uncharacterized membrane protein YjgN (DUF898 family)